MAKRLSDRERKKIIAYYVECQNYRETARRFKVADSTVRDIVRKDADVAQKAAEKKEQNTADILAYMDTKKEIVCQFIDTYLEAMLDPYKIGKATVNQLSTALGTVIDKFTIQGEKKAEQETLQNAKEILGGVDSVID